MNFLECELGATASNEKLDWGGDIPMSARFFKVSFQKMLDILKLVNELDRSLLLQKMSDDASGSILECMDIHQRIEARLRFVEFRIAFELGHDLPLKNGESVSHIQWAKDLHAQGAISEDRLERVLKSLPSEDLQVVLSTIEKMCMSYGSPF